VAKATIGYTRQQNETKLQLAGRSVGRTIPKAMAAACAVSAPSVSANQALLGSSGLSKKPTPRLQPSPRTRAFRVRAAKLPSGVSDLNTGHMILHLHIISQYLVREELVQGSLLFFYITEFRYLFRLRYPGWSQS
jgi:hypothetical protein